MDIWTASQIYSAQGVSTIKSILSSIYPAICGSCVFNLPIPLMRIKDYVYLILLALWRRKYDLLAIVYGYTMVICAVCLAMFLWIAYVHGRS